MVLVGAPCSAAGGGLRINGGRYLSLTQRQYLVVFVLALYAKMLANSTRGLATFARLLTKEGKDPAIEPSSPFLLAKSVLIAIQRILQECKPRPSVFREPETGPEDIIKIIFALREKLRKAGFDPDLIQTGDNGYGYRLNIEAQDLVITIPGYGPGK